MPPTVSPVRQGFLGQPPTEAGPEIAAAISAEPHRPQSTLESIASENLALVVLLHSLSPHLAEAA
jgi:glycine/serine hydroxymethyltransferase